MVDKVLSDQANMMSSEVQVLVNCYQLASLQIAKCLYNNYLMAEGLESL